eukprot:scaffold522456_cov33-Prasinocladus_malaysianus.AAC.1
MNSQHHMTVVVPTLDKKESPDVSTGLQKESPDVSIGLKTCRGVESPPPCYLLRGRVCLLAQRMM